MNPTEPGLRLALEFVDSRLAAIEGLLKSMPTNVRLLAARDALLTVKDRIIRALGPPQ